VDPLDRRRLRVEATGAGLGEALHATVGVAGQEQLVGTFGRAQLLGDPSQLGRRVGTRRRVDVGHDHRFDQLSAGGDEIERLARDPRGVREGVAEQLGDARGGDRLVHLVDVTQDR